jgi:hypothetical protein
VKKNHRGYAGPAPKLSAQKKLTQYLARHPSGLTTDRMGAWIDSCRREGGYSYKEFSTALYALRASGLIAFANGVWYLRSIPLVQKDT